MKNIIIAVVIIVVIIGGFVYFNSKKPEPYSQPQSQTTSPESTTSAQNVPGYQGKVIAGKSAPFLEFNKADYDKALAEGKIIVLDFYANWCPICRAEAPAINEGFNSLTSDKIIGFRVNFKDSDTDKNEEQLAKELKIPYQHTKVILKNGKEFSRSLDSWDRGAF